MSRRTQLSETLWAIAILVTIIVIVVLAIRRTTNDKEECEERGGVVVKVHNSQYGEWFCQEPRP